MITRRVANYKLVRDKKKDLEEIDWLRIEDFKKLVKGLPRPLVVVNGCFDILHQGHMKLIFAARDRAKTLIVALDSDRKVWEAKGEGRPIMSWVERATTMNYMPVDYLVEIDTDKEFTKLMTILKPDMRLQGQDYRHKESRCPDIPKMFVHSWGTRTTEIIERCKKA